MVATYGWGDIDRMVALKFATTEQVAHIQTLGGNGEELDLFIFDRQGQADPEQILKRFEQFGLRYVKVFSNRDHGSSNNYEGVQIVLDRTPEDSEILCQIERVKEGDHIRFLPEKR